MSKLEKKGRKRENGVARMKVRWRRREFMMEIDEEDGGSRWWLEKREGEKAAVKG